MTPGRTRLLAGRSLLIAGAAVAALLLASRRYEFRFRIGDGLMIECTDGYLQAKFFNLALFYRENPELRTPFLALRRDFPGLSCWSTNSPGFAPEWNLGIAWYHNYPNFAPPAAPNGGWTPIVIQSLGGYLWPIAVACLAIGAWTLHRRPAQNLCPRCNYDLSRLPPTAPCPECGRPSETCASEHA